MKNGQISLYIIFGLVILISLSLYFVLASDINDYSLEGLEELPSLGNTLRFFTESAVSDSEVCALYTHGLSQQALDPKHLFQQRIANFAAMESQGFFVLQRDSPRFKISYTDTTTNFKLNFPLMVKNSENFARVDAFPPKSFDVRLKWLKAAEKHIQKQDDINFHLLKQLGVNATFDGERVILKDPLSMLQGEEYLYVFSRHQKEK